MEFEVQVPEGEPGRLHLAHAAKPVAVLLLGHGAGGGVHAAELKGMAERLPSRGIAVARFVQPWKVAGRRVAGPAPGLDRAWQAALAAVGEQWPGLPLFAGGRSAGARVACRCYGGDQRGLVLSAFPLHPPGQPQKSRIDELAGVAGDALILQTEGDPFGGADELLDALAAEGVAPAGLVCIDARTHGPDTRSAAGRAGLPAVLDMIADEVVGFMAGRL